MQETWVQSLGWEDPLEKGNATPWRIPGTIQSMGSQRVGHDWATFTFIQMYMYKCTYIQPGGGQGDPLQYSCLENPHGQRSLVGWSPWSCKESGMTEQLSAHTHTHTHTHAHTHTHTHTPSSMNPIQKAVPHLRLEPQAHWGPSGGMTVSRLEPPGGAGAL